MILIVDVDLELLKDLHAHGSVRNLKDRRTDLYELTYKSETTSRKPVSLNLLTREPVSSSGVE
jgi:hypothetical protein